MNRLHVGFVLLLLMTGCATYEFDLVKPEGQARHIGSKSWEAVKIEPLEYRLRSYDNRLVMEIHNRSSEPIELLGERSTVVDPSGQSHPIRGQTIAPESFIKLIFPPIRPTVENWGPTFGVGVGYGLRTKGKPSPHTCRAPRYLTIYDDSNALYWDWNGQTDVRMMLVYRRGETNIGHEFVFHRRKM